MINTVGKVYCLEYIIFLPLSIILLVALLFLSKKYLTKHLDLEIRICSIIWLLLGITNRICEVYNQIYVLGNQFYSWKMILPFSLCSTLSIVFPIILLITKGNTKSLHYLVYASLCGGAFTFAYPAWIAEMPSFWNVEVIFGLLHHWMMLFVSILLIVTKKFVPQSKYYYVSFIGYACMTLYGLLLYTTVFNYTTDINIMNINKPLLEKLPYLTSWWSFMLIAGVILFIFLYVFERKTKNITFKKFIYSIIHKNN